MSVRKPHSAVSIQEYLSGEQDCAIRHEYVAGHVFAMAGASTAHNRIAINLTTQLNSSLPTGPCEVFMSDVKVMAAEDVYYYPDVMVACDAPGGDMYVRRQPLLIIEVSSPTTERTDRFEKLPAYQGIPSLREFLLVAQNRVFVEVHRRVDGKWEVETLTEPEQQLRLASIGLTLSLGEIYRNVEFEPTTPLSRD